MSILAIDHYGVIVRNLEDHYQTYMAHLLPRGWNEIYVDPLQEVRVCFLEMPGGIIELVEPTSENSPIAKALKKNVAMYHHVCVTSDDIGADVENCRQNGQFLISAPKPAVAFGGRQIAFVMGRDGLLWELLESPSGGVE